MENSMACQAFLVKIIANFNRQQPLKWENEKITALNQHKSDEEEGIAYYETTALKLEIGACTYGDRILASCRRMLNKQSVE